MNLTHFYRSESWSCEAVAGIRSRHCIKLLEDLLPLIEKQNSAPLLKCKCSWVCQHAGRKASNFEISSYYFKHRIKYLWMIGKQNYIFLWIRRQIYQNFQKITYWLWINWMFRIIHHNHLVHDTLGMSLNSANKINVHWFTRITCQFLQLLVQAFHFLPVTDCRSLRKSERFKFFDAVP